MITPYQTLALFKRFIIDSSVLLSLRYNPLGSNNFGVGGNFEQQRVIFDGWFKSRRGSTGSGGGREGIRAAPPSPGQVPGPNEQFFNPWRCRRSRGGIVRPDL